MNINKQRLLRAIKEAGIVLKYDDSFPTSFTAVPREGGRHVVTIGLGKMYIEGTEEQQAYLLAHELGHVYRGDLLNTTLDPKLWNIAADACIEHHLRPVLGGGRALIDADLKRVTGDAEAGLVSLEGLQAQVEKLNTVDASRARPIYDILREHCEDNGEGCGEGCGMVPVEGDEARDALKKAGAKLAGSKDYKSVGAGKDEPRQIERRIVVRSAEYGLAEKIREAMRAIATFARGKTSVRTRSWSRPGRVEGIPSVARVPRAKVVVAVDVSGSMMPVVERLCSLVEGVQREFDVIWVAWADTAALVSTSRDIENANVGGGTQLRPCLKLVKTLNPDLCVIVTDAQLSDAPSDPGFPALWTIVGDSVCQQDWGRKVRLG